MNKATYTSGVATSTGVKTSTNYPLTRNVVLWTGGITLLIVVIILALMIISYATRKLFFAPYKAQPVSSITGESNTKALGAESDYYYPNGRPDPETGLPPNSKTIPTGVSSLINNNLTQYKSVSTSALNGWGFISNT